MPSNARRLPAVPPLSAILPSGTEGAKEFARIVGLLLFQDAKRNGREFNLFDDASGDYEGLDSFSRPSQGKKSIGFQYKFFRSPLSDDHRREIKNSIERTAKGSKDIALEKYVIVTPGDLTNSARRNGRGDVAWLEALRGEYENHFEIEHFGHSKIQSLFLQTPHLCLYYYPSLVIHGSSKRKTIQEIRSQYDSILKTRLGRIEFVGMSVYKEEASRRIPLENIYIPLSVVQERAPSESEDTPRVNPLLFASPGARTVILGDPGSGKSTLMAFLALAGISEPLQRRCKAAADDRLTLVITLRRYADEIKDRTNLSILDYIVEVTRADFSIDAFDKDFLEFYLESGKAILLFDGLDELPGSGFKSTIRKRIESFNQNYPSNTVIVTSRIFGYEAEVRFDESYAHFRIAKLKTPEIERFISDWYAARIDGGDERDQNVSDLVRVISNPDNESIRDLARNPLLLTIVSLVHRIDAVLPDQRVVLYQKCTETLLNTWHKAKKRDEELAKGRIERRNRLRVEAIAYWMHRRSISERGRAVAPRSELLKFLTNYIENNESSQPGSEPPEDQAEIFLEFIRSGAGLLIEAGDGLYSFIHLTFQEYLCATHLTSFGEIGGAQSIWEELGGDLNNLRWREVVRLLVASLRSTMGQKFFVEKMLNAEAFQERRDSSLLLIGLLRDGIEPAEEEAHAIVTHALRALVRTDEIDDLRTVQEALKAWIAKHTDNAAVADSAFGSLLPCLASREILALALTRLAVRLTPLAYDKLALASHRSLEADVYTAYARLILNEDDQGRIPNWKDAAAVNDVWAIESPEGNVAAAAGLGISILLDSDGVPGRLLARELIMLGTSGYGPHTDHLANLIAIALPKAFLPPQVMVALRNTFVDRSRRSKARSLYSVLSPFMNGLFDQTGKRRNNGPIMNDRMRASLEEQVGRNSKLGSLLEFKPRRSIEDAHARELELIRRSFAEKMGSDDSSFWRMILDSNVYDQFIIPHISSYIDFHSISHWALALKYTLSDYVPSALSNYFNESAWNELVERVLVRSATQEDLDFAAWLLLLDVWVWEHEGYTSPADSPFIALAEAVEPLDYVPLKFAYCVRGVCQGDSKCQDHLTKLTAGENSPAAIMLFELGWPRPSVREKLSRRSSKPRGPSLTKPARR
ncbi:NACHT domain-containing protein [Azorhizobium sp. AG788]|uniref:NACHT domain-containing protein n=1 Tax=Azorhizobium sp. AG788 TaxID=2183897 RepID=UPI003139000B